jgi:scavenger receptor class B, member 1
LQRVILKNNSDILEWWLHPPVDPIVKVYIFNYTNIDSFLNGSDAKIKLQQVGPYTYRERIDKVNVRFDGDNITFHVSFFPTPLSS